MNRLSDVALTVQFFLSILCTVCCVKIISASLPMPIMPTVKLHNAGTRMAIELNKVSS